MRQYVPYALFAGSLAALAAAAWLWQDAQQQLAEVNDVRQSAAILMRSAARTHIETQEKLERILREQKPPKE
jgi:hypothetical protein